MRVSQDDLNDWALRASEIEWLAEHIGDALLRESVDLAGDYADNLRPVAHLLAKSLMRAGAVNPDPNSARHRGDWTDFVQRYGDSSPKAKRAAEALERAALLVLALEQETGMRGMGETLADFAAELNLYAFQDPHKEYEESE